MEIKVLRWRAGIEARTGILNFAALYGAPLGVEAVANASPDANTLRLADTTGGKKNFLGLLTRDCVVGGPTFLERMTGERHPLNTDENLAAHGGELPDVVGGRVTVRVPDELEAEGSTYLLTSGTGKLDAAGIASTVVGTTEVGIVNGKYRIAESTDGKVGIISGKNIADENGGTGRISILFYH